MRGTVFIKALIIVTVITSLPSKFLFYIAPLLVLTLGSFGLLPLFSPAFFWVMLIATSTIASSSLLLNEFWGFHTNYLGLALSPITWGAFLLLLVAYADKHQIVFTRREEKLITRFIAWYVIVESILGYTQFLMTWNSDAVTGSFGLLDGLTGNITINQVYFTFTLFTLSFFTLAYWSDGVLYKMAVIMGLTICALAQSGHQTIIFLVLSSVLGLTVFGWQTILRLSLAGALLLGVVLTVYPNTFEVAKSWFERTINLQTPKAQVMYEALQLLLENPKILLLGTGPGQFTSRASLISSGEYTRTPLPISDQSPWFEDIVLPLMYLHSLQGEDSAISQPYSSWISLIIEWGAPVVLLYLFWSSIMVLQCLIQTRHLYKLKNRKGAMLSAYMAFLLLFLNGNAVIENYFEFAQALTIPAMLVFFAKSKLAESNRETPSSLRWNSGARP